MNARGKTVSASTLKKGKRVLKGCLRVTKPIGKLEYTKAKHSSKRLSANKTNGAITVAKGTKKGTYKIRVTVRAKGDANHVAKNNTVTVKVTVK